MIPQIQVLNLNYPSLCRVGKCNFYQNVLENLKQTYESLGYLRQAFHKGGNPSRPIADEPTHRIFHQYSNRVNKFGQNIPTHTEAHIRHFQESLSRSIDKN